MPFFEEPNVGGACFNPEHTRRWLLWRWGIPQSHMLRIDRQAGDQAALQAGLFSDVRMPYILFIGYNPSTADEKINDPTVLREFNRARGEGYLLYLKMNVSSYISTNPDNLVDNEAGLAENHQVVKQAAKYAQTVVFAMGRPQKPMIAPAMDVINMVEEVKEGHGHKVRCFGLTKEGWPRHPLYLKTGTPLVGWALERKAFFSNAR